MVEEQLSKAPASEIRQLAAEITKQSILEVKDEASRVKEEVRAVEQEIVTALKTIVGKSAADLKDKTKKKLHSLKERVSGLENLFGKETIEKFFQHPLLNQGIDGFLQLVDQLGTKIDDARNIMISWPTLVKLLCLALAVGTVFGYFMNSGLASLVP